MTSHADVNIFCPAVTTAALARLYGVGFVLEPADSRGPTGAVFDRMIGNERLYRIPGAAVATLSAFGPGGALPGPAASTTPVAVTNPNPAAVTVRTDAASPQLLRLRLTDVPVAGQPRREATRTHPVRGDHDAGTDPLWPARRRAPRPAHGIHRWDWRRPRRHSRTVRVSVAAIVMSRRRRQPV